MLMPHCQGGYLESRRRQSAIETVKESERFNGAVNDTRKNGRCLIAYSNGILHGWPDLASTVTLINLDCVPDHAVGKFRFFVCGGEVETVETKTKRTAC